MIPDPLLDVAIAVVRERGKVTVTAMPTAGWTLIRMQCPFCSVAEEYPNGDAIHGRKLGTRETDLHEHGLVGHCLSYHRAELAGEQPEERTDG